MGWVAEILRKSHRECAVCRLAPIHLYAPEEADITALEVSPEPSGTPLCHACLGARMGQDLSEFEGRCLVFEPSMGPETYVFRPLGDAALAGRTERALESLPSACKGCGAEGRFVWVPVDHDAGLWADDWLPALESGELSAGEALCGRCTGARLARTLEERGLTFEAVTPASGRADGVLCGCEASLGPLDDE
ncbi:MAG: hypothetical protein ACREAA_20130 [Candidatus Polarisedimenticolia bacterium]